MSAAQRPGTDRRQFLGRTAAASAGLLTGASALNLLIPSFAAAKSGGVTSGDVEIVAAAQIAEALAVTTYTNIIDLSPFFKRLPEDDQGYLKAARQEEMSHYALEHSVTGKPSPFTSFYYPAKMFSDAQTTLDVLVTLEDAFIAAYLVGVRAFSTPDLRVLADDIEPRGGATTLLAPPQLEPMKRRAGRRLESTRTPFQPHRAVSAACRSVSLRGTPLFRLTCADVHESICAWVRCTASRPERGSRPNRRRRSRKCVWQWCGE